jgi:hypothetical protein
VIGHGVGVDFGKRAFLRTDAAREVAEVVNGQRRGRRLIVSRIGLPLSQVSATAS